MSDMKINALGIYQPTSISSVGKPKPNKLLRSNDVPNLQPTRAVLIPKEQKKLDRTLNWFENRLRDLRSYLYEYLDPPVSEGRKEYLNQKSMDTLKSLLAVNDWIKSDTLKGLWLKDKNILDDSSSLYFKEILSKSLNALDSGMPSHQLLGELEETKLTGAILNVSTYHQLYKENYASFLEKIAFQNTEASIQNRNQIESLKPKLNMLRTEEQLKFYEIQSRWKKEKEFNGYALLNLSAK